MGLFARLWLWFSGAPTPVVSELPSPVAVTAYRTGETPPEGPPEPPKLPLHKSITSCAKCGSGYLSLKYNKVEDAIHRWCGDCSYSWTERPLDTERITPGSGVTRLN